ncbi:hypothetical protein JQ543_16775 [Bradyrhizobium diazoefficiens]|nr:hypothetical protein [Bradyrhizobium diazoefficiens]MBR0849409.1 hypothetical protein [Bradyrhizobium diazoefficiens]
MAVVIGIHGIAQQNKGPQSLRAEWEPALRDGVAFAGGAIADGSFACAFYGCLFRPEGEVRSAAAPHFHPTDVTKDEADLLAALFGEAARVEPDRVAQGDLRAATPRAVQALLRQLAQTRFFAGLADHVMIGDLKQVMRYLMEPDVRMRARQSIDSLVTPDTRVLVAHSLGTVVTYEALHAYGGSERWKNVATLITLGSPLGIPNLIFDRLQPSPVDAKGKWPPGLKRWVNISDDGDVVALTKKLGPLFGAELVDLRIHNGATAHDVRPYLTARETGEAILHGLA